MNFIKVVLIIGLYSALAFVHSQEVSGVKYKTTTTLSNSEKWSLLHEYHVNSDKCYLSKNFVSALPIDKGDHVDVICVNGKRKTTVTIRKGFGKKEYFSFTY